MMMATNQEPSLRNIKAFRETVIKAENEMTNKKHQYDFYIYWSDKSIENKIEEHKEDGYSNVYDIIVNEDESIYRTFEKTYQVFKYISESKDDYDLYVRINISAFINMKMLDSVANVFKKSDIYCSAINSYINIESEYANDIYARGDFMLFGKNTLMAIVDNGEKYLYKDIDLKERINITHVDDCLMGLCVIDSFGKDYYKHIYMINYNFYPNSEDYKNILINLHCIHHRVKTIPPTATVSGYSWDDNEWREYDGKKMKFIQEKIDAVDVDYGKHKLPDVLVDKDQSRPTVFCQASHQNIFNVFWKYLEMKRQ